MNRYATTISIANKENYNAFIKEFHDYAILEKIADYIYDIDAGQIGWQRS